MMGTVTDISERPEDLRPGRLIETMGTCKYCSNLVTIKAAPRASEKEKDEIASAECNCIEGKDAREIETAVKVLTAKINDRYGSMPEGARRALISCLKPVAYGELDRVSVKVNTTVSIKIFKATNGLQLKRTTTEDDIMDEWSPS